MVDVAYSNAHARRDAVAKEINSLQQRIDDLRKEAKRVDEWLAAYSEFAGTAPQAIIQAEGNSEAIKPAAGRKNPTKEIIADYAYNMIKNRGTPIPRSEIMLVLKDAGILLEGKDPDMVLSTMLWRMKSKVVRLKKYGYWMADKDYPKADYFANIGTTTDKDVDLHQSGGQADVGLDSPRPNSQ